MPKIIPNIREQMLAETRKQIEEKGYAATTMRSVSGACGFAVGTMYNYFESKDMLVASFMLEDWKEVIGKIRQNLDSGSDDAEKLRFIYEGLLEFYKKHENIFKDPSARRTFSHSTEERHPLLIHQISAMILPIISESDIEDKSLLADFISESMLTWSMSGREYACLKPIFTKLI